MSDHLVSIVTPAYNAARFIGESINSVLAQTYPHWEMIIVDDCSKDNTRELVEQYTQKDPRIRLLKQSKNGGPALARDMAIQAAKGRYIAFLDTDDLWLPTKLEDQLKFMEEKVAAISFTGFRRMTEIGDVVGRLIPVPDYLTYSQSLKNTALATSTVVVDRETTGPLEMKEAPCDDFVLWSDILNRGFVAYGLKKELMRYRVVSSSWSRNKFKYAKKVWDTYRYMGLSVPYTCWCFTHYAVRAWLKYRKF